MGQTKCGDLFALDIRNGHLVWRDKVGIQHHTDAIPRPQGSETLWPGNQYGVEACHTNNNDTVYAAVAIWHCLSIQTECLIMYIYVADNTNSKSSVVFKN